MSTYPNGIYREEKKPGTTTKDRESLQIILEIIDQAIDTSTASGKAFLQMLGVFAEFETNLRKERQMAGIAKAKAEGKHLGRKTKERNQREKENGSNANRVVEGIRSF